MTLILLFFLASADHHRLGNADRHANRFAKDRANEVATALVRNSRDRWQKVVDDSAAVPGGLPRTELITRAEGIFGPSRAELIVTTEATNAVTEAGELAARNHSRDTGDDRANDTWYTEEDQRVCPICRPLHGTKRAVWSRVAPLGPPAHERCRCWVNYRGTFRKQVGNP